MRKGGQQQKKGFKEHLPTKVCPICNRLFSWRKRWRKTWETVIYCSDKCRRTRSGGR